PSDTPLQLLLPKIQVGETMAEWIEAELTPQITALAAAISTTTGTSITVASGDGADKFPPDVTTYNTVIRVDQEYMLVTAISGDVCTVVRGYGSTTAAIHSSGASVHIISQMEHEGANGKKAVAKLRSKPSNFLQTFSRTVEVSGIQEAIKKLGGITSEVDYQIMQAMRQLALELEKTMIMGVKAQVGDGSTSFRTMGGLWAMIKTNRTLDSGSIDTAAIEDDIRKIWDSGGIPRAIITSGKLAQDISNIYSSRIQTDIFTTVGGVNVTSIINPLGVGPIAIIPHRLVADGEYYMLDTTRIALGYLRPFHMKLLANDGDAERRWIGGDYTIELMNEKAHAYRYGFS
ncbi:MAG: hypothetical protein QG641_2982, partial [Candidatus Poribacteria bacterium]|nr:hypothetical protein [Candidatus Poribacteria bacterium]